MFLLLPRIASLLPAPRTGDLNMLILIAVILITAFMIFIVLKRRRR